MSSSIAVFVGSTFTDLQEYRTATRDALHRLEAVVRGMEYFGSLPDTPKEECLRIVRSCRVYVGIFGMRYGSIDTATGKSLTHLEYDEAQRIGLPSLIYLLDEDRQPVLPKFVETGDGAVKLQELKALLCSQHVVTAFTTPEDLASKLIGDLPPLASRSGFEVREGELAKLVAALPRIDWLTDERFHFFKRELGEVIPPGMSDAVLRESLEFILAGDNLAATFLMSRTMKTSLRDSIDLLMDIEERIKKVAKRGYALLKEQGRKGSNSPPAI
jgi:hypothetical protein